MSFVPLSFLGSLPIETLLVSVYLIILFHLIVVSSSSFCVFLSLCVASVVLALVVMPGLCVAPYRAAYLAQPAKERFMWLPFVCFFCLCFLFFVGRDDVLSWLLSCLLSSV